MVVVCENVTVMCIHSIKISLYTNTLAIANNQLRYNTTYNSPKLGLDAKIFRRYISKVSSNLIEHAVL